MVVLAKKETEASSKKRGQSLSQKVEKSGVTTGAVSKTQPTSLKRCGDGRKRVKDLWGVLLKGRGTRPSPLSTQDRKPTDNAKRRPTMAGKSRLSEGCLEK